MSTRGAKKRGRPPKVQVTERTKKFQYHLLKKPKYLQNLSKGSDSQSSTPNTSRPSSPQESDISRRSSTRGKCKDGHKSRRGGLAGSAYPRRGYNPNADYHDSEYHYGSDFGDDSSDKSELEDDLGLSGSETEGSVGDGDHSSDSDFSLSSFSTMSGTPRRQGAPRPPTPEPLWLQNRELPSLNLPKSSEDLLVPKEYIMPVLSIYEVLRHFRNLVRLSPFRLEDFCAALMCEDQNALLAEVHIMLLKALLREEDSQQTHFGPLDQKDSVNISLYLIDYMTYPEVLRAYVESDKTFDSEVLHIFNSSDYPFTCLEDRIKVLQFLTDQFLTTNPVREDLLSEVPMHYDDHCRVCHKLGDLLCCETCPAVYHLECVDPPLTDVPEEDWQCNICRSHKVSGVVDCILDQEKQGQLCRQEHLGCDRHGRKYFFLCRRLFIESEDEVWYYSTPLQFEEVLKVLDENEMESHLCRELHEYKEEIVRQMELTEKLTNQLKGNKKSYLEFENAKIIQLRKEIDEKKEEEVKEKGRQATEDMGTKIQGDASSSMDSTSLDLNNSVNMVNNEMVTPSDVTSDNFNANESGKSQDTTNDENDSDKQKDSLKIKSTVSTPKAVNIEELRRRTTAILSRDDLDKKTDNTKELTDSLRMTRLKSTQIANGTYLYKLGMENSFKSYINQYTTNPIALNKPQRNEERDKKRHLSHKFSLTTASEFKWIGGVSGNRTLLLNTLRQTILQLEQVIPSPFMHPNWTLIRKHWFSVVNACQQPKDFARALIVLHACMKSVVFANVWHEQLGHVKLLRMTAAEREERKKIEKREKKEREEEEERNRMMITGYVKYTMGFKHQLWKQKGEEYRIHGRWGWLWLSASRIHKIQDSFKMGLAAGPQKYMVQVQDQTGYKILSLEPKVYEYLNENFVKSQFNIKDEKKPEECDGKIEDKELATLKNLKVIQPITELEEINVSSALTIVGRLLYPKVAKKSKLDDLLSRRVHLKELEEDRIKQIKHDNPQNEDEAVDVENDEDSMADSGLEKQLNNMLSGKVNIATSMQQPQANREILNTIAKKIQALRIHYTSIMKLGKDFACYSKGCNSNAMTLENTCYSSLCLQKYKVRKELLSLLKRANMHTYSHGSMKLSNLMGMQLKKPSILEQKLTSPPIVKKEEKETVSESSLLKELTSAVISAQKVKVDPNCAAYVPKKTEVVTKEAKNNEVKTLVKKEDANEIKMEVDYNVENKVKENSKDDTKMENMTPEAIKEMILGPNSSKEQTNKVKIEDDDMDIEEIVTDDVSKAKNVADSSVTEVTKTTTVTTHQTFVGGVLTDTKANTTSTVSVTNVTHTPMRTIQTLNAKTSVYSAQHNRRFCTYRVAREEKMVKAEHAEDGTQRVYTTISTEGRVYLKKVPLSNEKRKKRAIVKYPVCSTFSTKKGLKSLLVLPTHEVRRVARNAGRVTVIGFHHIAKPNTQVWPYPCSRPLFKTCWLYRTVNLKALSAVALQLRILWACLRWDDMQMKPPTSDGKHQITTETEILSLELLKHRQVGRFSERTQYLRRKVVIPLELPKTVREVTSIRSGLRKRKRPESPQSTDPQVSEEWVDEDKLELWEIKQYGEKSRTGNLPPARPTIDSAHEPPSKITVTTKATPEEIKEKMEQQLRMQRAAHQQKRALELKNLPTGQVIKVVGSPAQAASATTSTSTTTTTSVTTTNTTTSTKSATSNPTPIQPKGSGDDVQMKVVKNVIVPNTATPGKSTLTSLLTANNAAGVNKYAGRRIFMTKGPDGSTRVIAGSPGIITKGAQAVQQSLIKVQTTGGQTVQQIQIQQPVTTAATPTKQSDVPQRVQIMRTPDGRLTVKGLMPGQQLIQMPDGKLQVLCTTQIQQQTPASGAGTASATTISSGVVQKLIQQPSPTTAVVPTKTVIKSAITSAGKVIVQQQKNATVIAGVQQTQAQQQPLTQSPNKTQVVIKQQTPVLQKVNTPPGTVVVSGGQPVIQQQVVVSGQQVVTTSGGQQQVVTNQFIVPNQQVAQQLASGKLQIATINGQQVLIRPTGNGQAQVVAQITTGTITQTQQQTPQPQTTAAITPVKQLLQQQQSIQDQQTTTSAAVVTNQQQTSTATKSISVDNSIDPATMEQLLAGQPPGTVIKCVTAQVIQTQQGPRIVLQGLQGADFTPQQLAAVQQQVKQQLLKAQASTGKQGVLGPTKIYLAVQPPASSDTASESQPPPLAPVQHVNQMNHQQMAASATTTPVSVVTNMVKQQAINSAVTQTSEASSVREVLVNGQQSSALLQAMKVNMEASQQQHTGVIQQTTNATTLGGSNSVTTGISGGGSGGGNKQFVVTPDYIQQSMLIYHPSVIVYNPNCSYPLQNDYIRRGTN
ncbi:nucleosome-remodeling factor subunit NURF301 isoform X2 [Agrilus planipennis]|uniref:Nucleosome-remodeling factor subunit NURF301 isoform X2 n=1 Tax=Agrilus planipennis TaxID=224129 RepID=A0A7F5REH5_AGRPL|nr:nucleosome-remodeling factor subunit NURF301 isoform X2 [Agrilus planipennis]